MQLGALDDYALDGMLGDLLAYLSSGFFSDRLSIIQIECITFVLAVPTASIVFSQPVTTIGFNPSNITAAFNQPASALEFAQQSQSIAFNPPSVEVNFDVIGACNTG